MKRVFRPFLAVLFCAVISASGCGSEDEALEEETPGADVTTQVAEDVAEKAEPATEVDASSSGVSAANEDVSAGDVDAQEPSAADEAKQEASTRAQNQRKKSFYGESGDLEGTPVEPPAAWRRVTCDGDSACVVGGEFSGASLVQILHATEEAKKLQLSIQNGTNLSSLGLLEVLRDKVETLQLRNLPGVDNLSALGDLRLLTSLELSNMPLVTDLTALENLVKLTNFRMEALGCVKLDSLRALRGLKELHVDMQQRVCAVDMSALGGMGALERLTLHTPNLGNLDEIEGAGALKEIFLWGAVRNFEPLAKLRNLETLTLHASPVQDLSDLSLIPNLKTLKIQAGHVWNYKGLLKARKLRYLHVTEAQSRIFQNVKILRQLDGLTLHRGKPKDWAEMAELPWLKHLDLSFTDFKDVALLKKLPKLKSFGCARCRLKNGIVFSELTGLEEINIAGATGGPTLNQLGQMPNLKKLTIRRRQFGRTALQRLIKVRPQVRIIYASGRYRPLGD